MEPNYACNTHTEANSYKLTVYQLREQLEVFGGDMRGLRGREVTGSRTPGAGLKGSRAQGHLVLDKVNFFETVSNQPKYIFIIPGLESIWRLLLLG